MNHFFSFNYMKYITLLLILSVLIYYFQNNPTFIQTIATDTPTQNELPIYCVDTQQSVIALTFDSAWGTEDLDEILAILKKHNAPATFFVTGQWVKDNPKAILSISAAGHELGNHGMNHKHMPNLSETDMIQEIKECHDEVLKLTGQEMHMFRAPYSDWNETVVKIAHSLDYMSINQSVDSLDWKDYGVNAIIDTVCNHKNLENGSIILLHNGSAYTKDALDTMLTNLENQGYSFVLVSDLIYKTDYSLDHTGKQFSNKKE